MKKPDLTPEQATVMVARGANFLDRRLGKRWRRKIDLAKLDLSAPCLCVQGQLLGRLTNDQFQTLIKLMEIDDEEFGFNLPAGYKRGHASWNALNNAWIKEIERK